MVERYFRTIFLDEAELFIQDLNPIARDILIRKIDKAETTKDPVVFKKLKHDIWEFRMRFGFMQIRLLAFWDKSDRQNTLVLATHGFVKKTDRVPGKEIERAINIRNKYFENKN